MKAHMILLFFLINHVASLKSRLLTSNLAKTLSRKQSKGTTTTLKSLNVKVNRYESTFSDIEATINGLSITLKLDTSAIPENQRKVLKLIGPMKDDRIVFYLSPERMLQGLMNYSARNNTITINCIYLNRANFLEHHFSYELVFAESEEENYKKFEESISHFLAKA